MRRAAHAPAVESWPAGMVLAGAELAGGRLPRVRRNPVATRCIFRDPARETRRTSLCRMDPGFFREPTFLSSISRHKPPPSRCLLLLSYPRTGIPSCLFLLLLFLYSLVGFVEDDARWTVKHIEHGGNRFHSGSGRSSPPAWRSR